MSPLLHAESLLHALGGITLELGHTEVFTEAFIQHVHINAFDGLVMLVFAVLPSAPAAAAHLDPVRRAKRCAVMMLMLHKGFQKPGAVVITLLEVVGKAVVEQTKDFGDQVRAVQARADEQAAEANHLIKMLGPLRGAPANPGVPVLKRQSRRGKAYRPQTAVIGFDEVAELTTDQAPVSEGMLPEDHFIPTPEILLAADQTQGEVFNQIHPLGNPLGRGHGLGKSPGRGRALSHDAGRRKQQRAFIGQLAQGFETRGLLRHSPRIVEPEVLTKLRSQGVARMFWAFGKKLTDKIPRLAESALDLVLVVHSAVIAECASIVQ